MSGVKHIPALDGIRGVAALMVMFFHFFQNAIVQGPFLEAVKKMAVFGQTGVSLFFVLSGFLITRILIQNKSSEGFFMNFYARRSLRIFPLYYLYLFLVFILLPLFHQHTIPDFSKQLYHWIYFQDFAITFKWEYAGPLHFWSLAVEEHFYLFFPLLVYFLSQRNLLVALTVILVSSILLRYLFIINSIEVFYFTFTRMDELAIGALLSILEIRSKLSKSNSKFFLYALLFFLVPITLLVWFKFGSTANPILQVFKFCLIYGVYFCFIGFIVSVGSEHVMSKLFTSRFLKYAGKISYGLYVYHGLCFEYFSKFFETNIFIKFIGSFCLAFLISSISFYFFENLFLKYKYKFQDRKIDAR